MSSLQYINNVAARIYNNICAQYTQLCCRSVYLQEYINTPPSTPRILSTLRRSAYSIWTHRTVLVCDARIFEIRIWSHGAPGLHRRQVHQLLRVN